MGSYLETMTQRGAEVEKARCWMWRDGRRAEGWVWSPSRGLSFSWIRRGGSFEQGGLEIDDGSRYTIVTPQARLTTMATTWASTVSSGELENADGS